MVHRLLLVIRQHEYIYSVDQTNEDINGYRFKVNRLLIKNTNCFPLFKEKCILFIDNLPVAAIITYELKQNLKGSKILLKKLSFTVPNNQNVDDIIALVIWTVVGTAVY